MMIRRSKQAVFRLKYGILCEGSGVHLYSQYFGDRGQRTMRLRLSWDTYQDLVLKPEGISICK